METYKTILAPTESFLREKGSKFYGYAHPVAKEGEIKEILTTYKKQYYDATHHCYAYSIGTAQPNTRANDDGEPNHSAGDPILGQIKSLGLTNVLVVVVRYYGGAKLGVGGLIAAYKTAAHMALQTATIIENTITSEVQIEFPYESTSEVMRQVSLLGIEVQHQDFGMDCMLIGQIPVGNKAALLKNLELAKQISITYK